MNTILLIEDELELAQVIVRELEVAGYQVLYAADGGTGLEMYEAERPDLILLDWMLPGLDGIEVLRRLRQGLADPTAVATPVLMLTARREEIDRVVGLEVGADDYLTKPFSMRELMARVRALLRRVEEMERILAADRAQADGALAYANGRLRLDPQAYRATLDGQLLDLTPTEFELLHLLLRNPGRAFSRNYLLDAVWGESYIIGDRSVDNAILRLRKKLGELGEAVETVWGVGYRLRSE